MSARLHTRGAQPDRELRDLRHHVGAIPRGRGRRFPAALRERLIAWAVARRARGAGWSELARELGVPAVTLQRWLTPRPERMRQVTLRPVAITDEPVHRTLMLVAPSGLRIEGVTLADVIAILRGLT